MRVVAIVQARMGSSRLPNKVMALICGMPMIQHVIRRTGWTQIVWEVILAIPNTVENDSLEYFARHEGIHCYRGEEDDLLARTLGALAECPEMDAVVRVTGDCPLVDPKVIREVVAQFQESDMDYVSNVFPRRTDPAGIAVEVYSVELLHRLDEMIKTPRYREYYMAYLWEHASQFKIGSVEHTPDISHLRWTVDELEDLVFVRAIYNELGWSRWGTKEVLELLTRRPELAQVNTHIPIEPFHGLEKR